MAADAVLLEGLQFYGYHGAMAEERTLGQRFDIDVEVECDLSAAGQSDDLSKSVNYGTVYDCVRQVVEGPPRSLIETVAEEIAASVLATVAADAVTVTVRKPSVPLGSPALRSVAVRIRRTRSSA